MKYDNTIYFENGIEHTLTEKGYEEELENLKNLFLEHLD